jgi:quinol monooxygenase YgiN
MIHVIAIITAKAGQRENMLAAARANIPAVRAEDGCVEYSLAVDTDAARPNQALFGPDTFVFIEKWRDADALRAHAASPHMKDYGSKIKELVASRAVHVLSPAD